MARFIKKVETKDAVTMALQKYIGETGGKKYRQIMNDIMNAIDELPQYNLVEDYSSYIRRVE